MGFVNMTCPSCGAKLDFSEDKEYMFCPYCGTKVVQEKQLVELSGSVNVSGLANEVSLLERAYLFIEDGAFDEGTKYLNRVLDINPKCAKAYMGLLLCRYRYRTISRLSKHPYSISNNSNYQKAIRFSTGKEKTEYEGINKEIIENHQTEFQAKADQIQNIRNELDEKQTYLESNQAEYKKKVRKSYLFKVLLVVAILNALLWLICTIAVLPMLILLVPSIGLIIFICFKNKNNNQAIQDYKQKELELEEYREYLKSEELDFSSWEMNWKTESAKQ